MAKGSFRGKVDGKPFTKGDPRINKAGRPKKLPALDELLCETLGEKVSDIVALRGILIALRKKAMAGDVRAAELLLDRAYGKLRTNTGVELDFMRLTEGQIDQLIARLIQ